MRLFGKTLTSKCRSEERDMCSLIVRNLFQVVVEGLIEASLFEVLESEVGKTFTVELVLCELLDQRLLRDQCGG
jgi:hypothetical protein